MSDMEKKIKEDAYAAFLGIRMDDLREGFASCSLTITKEMFNFLGAVHGGLIFSLADVAFAAASNFNHPPSYALDVSGSFLKTAKVGDTITARAELIHTTKRTGLYRMQVFKDKELLATFNGTVFRKA
jgi:acyl-CoA thioesterase